MTTQPARNLVRGVVLALGASLAVLSLAAPAEAVTTVSLSVSRTEATAFVPVTFSGKVSGSSSGATLSLQRQSGTWGTVARTLVRSDGTYSLTIRAALGSFPYRTVASGNSRISTGYSATKTVTGWYGGVRPDMQQCSSLVIGGQLPSAVSRTVAIDLDTGKGFATARVTKSATNGLVKLAMTFPATGKIRFRAPATTINGRSFPAFYGPTQTYTTRSSISAGSTRILCDTNAYRVRSGKAPLILHSGIVSVSQLWAQTMALLSKMFHNPSYTKQLPGGWTRAGENVAAGQRPDTVVQAWINSSGHRANLLGDYTHIGIGFATSTSSYGSWFVQNFAKY